MKATNRPTTRLFDLAVFEHFSQLFVMFLSSTVLRRTIFRETVWWDFIGWQWPQTDHTERRLQHPHTPTRRRSIEANLWRSFAVAALSGLSITVVFRTVYWMLTLDSFVGLLRPTDGYELIIWVAFFGLFLTFALCVFFQIVRFPSSANDEKTWPNFLQQLPFL